MVRKISQQEVLSRYEKHKLLLLESYVNATTKLKTRCRCGQEFYPSPHSVFAGLSTSCGCHHKERASRAATKNLLNRKFGRLKVVAQCEVDRHGRCRWKCICDCGNHKEISSATLLSGSTQSCGCLGSENRRKIKNNLTNLTFGNLTVIGLSHRKSRRVVYDCLCSCGKRSIVQYSHLTTGQVSSCGGCLGYRNGVRASKNQIKISNMVGGVINFKTSTGKFVDIALRVNNRKVAIEYDEWYWHNNKIGEDSKRVSELLSMGWAVVTIRAHSDIPGLDCINKAIEYVSTSNGRAWYIITLDSWINKNEQRSFSR